MTRREWLIAGSSLTGMAAALYTTSGSQAGHAASPVKKRLVKTAAEPPHSGAGRIVGPGGGGAQYYPTISPHDDKLILVACDMTGVYLSENGGDLWRIINLRGSIRFITFDPLDPAVIYVGTTTGVMRSEDRGRTWNLVIPKPSNASFRYADDRSEERRVGKECRSR